MEPNYTELDTLLERRINIISDSSLEKDVQLVKLQEVSECIDGWRERNREFIHPQLLHFLDNYSLQKAQKYIQKYLK